MDTFISGGMTCQEFQEVITWLVNNGHFEQSYIAMDLFYDQYCGAIE